MHEGSLYYEGDIENVTMAFSRLFVACCLFTFFLLGYEHSGLHIVVHERFRYDTVNNEFIKIEEDVAEGNLFKYYLLRKLQ